MLTLRAARTIDWRAALLAGLVAGAGAVAVEALLSLFLFRGLISRQLRMIAAVVLGDEILLPTAVFDLDETTGNVSGDDVVMPTTPLDPRTLLTALAVVLAISVVYAIILAWLILRFRFGAAMLIGVAFGLLLYLFHFHGLAAVYPWFRTERNWASVVTHVGFGMFAALQYKTFARRRKEAGPE